MIDMQDIKQIVKGDGNTVNINKGLGVEDVYQLALKLFTDNFPILQQQAIDVVNNRIDVFLKNIEIKIVKPIIGINITKWNQENIPGTSISP